MYRRQFQKEPRMDRNRSSRRFAADNRAVSAVVGFILIFGILMLTLTVYQAQIVPQQNAQTEFEQYEETRDELIELRNAISTAGQANLSQFPSITLGTSYQSRLLTINPAPAAGTLQTSEYNISIGDESGSETNISTQFIEYQPGYNEIIVGPTWYEHSVLYEDRETRNAVTLEDQHLVTDGNELKITALQNSFQRSGTSRVTVELTPNQSAVDLDDLEDDEELTVRIPTRLDEDYWDVLDEELDAEDSVGYEGVDDGSDVNHLALNVTNKDHLDINRVDITS